MASIPSARTGTITDKAGHERDGLSTSYWRCVQWKLVKFCDLIKLCV
jgi:hypothetical protein